MTTQILRGDCREILPTLAAESFDCVVTSPPYWGLRDYGAEGQIGLEPMLDDYVEALAQVAGELWRVLKPEGTFWLNLGDSYSSATKGTGGGSKKSGLMRDGRAESGRKSAAAAVERQHQHRTPARLFSGLKPKDLCMVPARVALRLQADGWFLRSEIIWAKPNPMPESVTDRPTAAHEKIYLFTKSERYFYDAGAIAEPVEYASEVRVGTPKNLTGPAGKIPGSAYGKKLEGETRNARNVWTVAPRPYKGAHFAPMPTELVRRCLLAGCPAGGTVLDPFGGAGTTGLVAQRFGRHATLIEINPEFAELPAERIMGEMALFAEVATVEPAKIEQASLFEPAD